MSDVSVSKLLRALVENPELFSAVQSAGNVDELSATLAAGQQIEILNRKTVDETDEDAVSEGREMIVNLAEWVLENIKKSGTSGDQRVSVPTASGKFTIVLSQD